LQVDVASSKAMVDNHGSGRQTENQLTNFLSMTENSLDLPEKRNSADWNTDEIGRSGYSQFDGFVPHDGVPRQRKCLDVHNVNVAMIRSDIHPLGLERQVAERYPTNPYTSFM